MNRCFLAILNWNGRKLSSWGIDDRSRWKPCGGHAEACWTAGCFRCWLDRIWHCWILILTATEDGWWLPEHSADRAEPQLLCICQVLEDLFGHFDACSVLPGVALVTLDAFPSFIFPRAADRTGFFPHFFFKLLCGYGDVIRFRLGDVFFSLRRVRYPLWFSFSFPVHLCLSFDERLQTWRIVLACYKGDTKFWSLSLSRLMVIGPKLFQR